MIIDSHAHLNFKSFEGDLKEVLERCRNEQVRVINVGTKLETSKKAVEIAENNEGMYASVGLHPVHMITETIKIRMDEEEGGFSPKGEEFDGEEYKRICKSEKVVAIGEIGLDFYYKPKTKIRIEKYKSEQSDLLLKQMKLAKELNLPVIFHCRKAHDLLIAILKKDPVLGVIHCFTGTWQEAERYLEMGLYLGINGIMYKQDIKETIEKFPLERLLLETDSPYLIPKGIEAERNEPCYIKQIAKDVARIRGISFEEVIEATSQNAQNLFGI
ncbi:MAG: hypothetical protein A2365_02180 [Candidatus Nealsonbacteria bacterium RIFOXYB1_FULL_40_15]|uniref:Hydrolase TatD n=2 Tax=Candidatus Nealsoniibacteriota TaxID=1817911 RepID=A0A1G2ETP4_9BACT|nr:MAG: hypothetical protein A2365_02180 [Candidatus Nealsonbacteria bacterium RIFOXYB1_FULL_40_15]OGZ28462.1 MAG: hypothetical protein A2562_03260 [Candidatus Nealsonbacteria bacterium RIFOXYD1_FULL_39_11]OGZ28648.1 MAG: hypothetical protein A2427_04535 [Candidatus Nealsonbacteria bacterium RIFOXYC1_FULL_40_7]